ncbi:MAG: cell wall hydrolase [Lachnospiraceae bacterium]|nr:cell wall hydrolase [Lachnospiraceae bacterium]
MKKKINKRAITLGILTAITVSLFASVLVVYGKDQDRKAQNAALRNEVCSQAVVLDNVNMGVQKTIPVVKTIDAVDIVAVAAEEKNIEEEHFDDEEYVEGAFYDDYTETMSKEYNLSPGIYGFSSRDAYILACIVSAEVGDQDYDCQLAVANVVIHRGLNLGGCPGAIEEAVYQPSQFEPAYTTMQNFLAYGPQEDAIRASQDALHGIDNVPGYEHFCYFTIMDGYLDCDGGQQIGSEWFYY